jgi:hypothetical protein
VLKEKWINDAPLFKKTVFWTVRAFLLNWYFFTKDTAGNFDMQQFAELERY